MQNKLSALVMCLLLGLASVGAHAGFVNKVKPEPVKAEVQADVAAKPFAAAAISATAQPVVVAPVAPTRLLIEQGVRPKNLPTVRGKGQAMPIGDVLAVLVPADMRVNAGELNRGQQVTWAGGSDWPTVLDGLMFQLRDTSAVIDWNLGALTFKSTAISAAPKTAWAVKASDVTLRQALERWGRESNPTWQIAWEVKVDFPVQLEAVFSGDFDDALTKFMDSLKGSDHPLQACLYDDNHVVRVLHYGDKKECFK